MKYLLGFLLLFSVVGCGNDCSKCGPKKLKVGDCIIQEHAQKRDYFRIEKVGEYTYHLQKFDTKKHKWESGYSGQIKNFMKRYSLGRTDCPENFINKNNKGKWK